MNQPLRVLLVQDEDDAVLLLDQLQDQGGYDLTNERVETAPQLKTALLEQTWDIIISDYSLSQFSAIEALELLRETELDLPFIVVSGQIGEEAAVAALKAGAQDFVTKRNLSQLVPAVERELQEACLRRSLRRTENEKQLLQTLTQCVSDAPDFNCAIALTLRRVCETIGWHCGEAWIPDTQAKVLRCSSAWYSHTLSLQTFREYSQSLTFGLGSGMPGVVWADKQPLWIPDLSAASEITYMRVQQAKAAGLGAGLAIPLLVDDEVLAVLVFMMLETCVADSSQVELISAVAAQLSAVLQRKQAESALRQAEAKYHSLFENAVVGIFQTTPDGRYISANPALAKIYGYDSTAELMVHLTDIQHQLYVDANRRDEFIQLMQQYDAVSEFEAQVYRKDRSVIWILENARAVRDESGRLLYYEGFVEDVTQRHQAESDLKKAKEQLEVRVEERTTQLREANDLLVSEIVERQRAQAMLSGQNQVLELILRGTPLPEVLDVLARAIEQRSPAMKCSFLLLDPNGINLRHGAAPSLPDAYNRAVDGIAIGPAVGWGTAAYRKEPIIVEDIATDPLWVDFRDLALFYGLKACWSIPILTLKGEVLGTFAIYYEEPRTPSDDDRELIIKTIHLAGIAIERDRTQSALNTSNARFHKLSVNVPGVIYQFLLKTDGSFAFPYISPSCHEICELTPAEIQQNPTFAIDMSHKSDRQSFQDSLLRSTQTLQPWEWEGRITTPSGKLKWIQGSARPERQTDGSTLWDGLLMDITERKAFQEALQHSEAKLRQQTTDLEQALHELQRTQMQLVQTEKMSSLGQLVAGVAHEINNPISFIYGNLTYACQYTQDILNLLDLYHQHYPYPLAPEIQAKAKAIDLEFLREDLPKMLSSMQLGTDRICQIVLSLRNFSRVDSSAVCLVDIHEGIDSTLLILQHRTKPKGKYPGIEIIKEYGDLPLVECYAGQLNQVFMNILANAIDALDDCTRTRSPCAEDSGAEGAIAIRTQLKNNSHVVIQIRDNGPGIPASNQNQLFNAFFTTKPVGKGTGLGLSISYQIVVDKHSGVLKCISEPGKGTEFWIEIPIRQTS